MKLPVDAERCKKCFRQIPLNAKVVLECGHSFCKECSQEFPPGSVCPKCMSVEENPFKCCRCFSSTEDGRALLLKCQHTVCAVCIEELLVNSALTCPLCNRRTFFEEEPEPDPPPPPPPPTASKPSAKGGPNPGKPAPLKKLIAHLRRKQTGTFCPHCGASFLSRSVTQVDLKCDHIVCLACAEELCINGAVACPVCTKRTFFEPISTSSKEELQNEVNDADSGASSSLKRKETGTYCHGCGESLMARSSQKAFLDCGHQICSTCASRHSIDGLITCPTCDTQTRLEEDSSETNPRETKVRFA